MKDYKAAKGAFVAVAIAATACLAAVTAYVVLGPLDEQYRQRTYTPPPYTPAPLVAEPNVEVTCHAWAGPERSGVEELRGAELLSDYFSVRTASVLVQNYDDVARTVTATVGMYQSNIRLGSRQVRVVAVPSGGAAQQDVPFVSTLVRVGAGRTCGNPLSIRWITCLAARIRIGLGIHLTGESSNSACTAGSTPHSATTSS